MKFRVSRRQTLLFCLGVFLAALAAVSVLGIARSRQADEPLHAVVEQQSLKTGLITTMFRMMQERLHLVREVAASDDPLSRAHGAKRYRVVADEFLDGVRKLEGGGARGWRAQRARTDRGGGTTCGRSAGPRARARIHGRRAGRAEGAGSLRTEGAVGRRGVAAGMARCESDFRAGSGRARAGCRARSHDADRSGEPARRGGGGLRGSAGHASGEAHRKRASARKGARAGHVAFDRRRRDHDGRRRARRIPESGGGTVHRLENRRSARAARSARSTASSTSARARKSTLASNPSVSSAGKGAGSRLGHACSTATAANAPSGIRRRRSAIARATRSARSSCSTTSARYGRWPSSCSGRRATMRSPGS